MIKEQITKENLMIELAKVRQSHENWVAGDERRRKEFAKAFFWYETRKGFMYNDSEEKFKIPSWEEIFVKIGKLLNSDIFQDSIGDIETLKMKIEALELKDKKENENCSDIP